MTVALSSERDSIGSAIGRIPSGCCILTVTNDGRSTGVLVSWVQQAAFDPPTISVCLKRGRPAGPLIDAAGRFLLNIIPEDAKPMFRHFGRGFSPEEDAFAGLSVVQTEFGPLLGDCIAHLGCKVVNQIAVGDHDLYVAEVVAARGADASPYVHLRKNGLSY